MIQLQPHERCICARPHNTGRYYLKRPACGRCNRFIVLSAAERAALEGMEAVIAERERQRGLRAAAAEAEAETI